MLRDYWRFYWPLALTVGIMVLGGQFQNGVLARYPEAVTELAVYAIASGTFGLFHATVNFVSQMSNVYARSPVALRKTLIFVVVVSALLASLLLILAHTDTGVFLIGTIYGVDQDIIRRILRYLELFTPLMLIDGLRQFQLGLLVQNRMTGRVTVLNLIQLSVMITGLMSGFSLGLPAPIVLVGSQLVSSVLHLALLIQIVRRDYRLPSVAEHENLKVGELISFFVPVATTGVMFAVSRPVLYAFIARTPDAIVSIAAMRVGFDVATLFQMTANQFRHFFVTFGDTNLREKRLFMFLVGSGITAVMLIIALTPLSTFLLSDLIGVKGKVLLQAREVLMMMCVLPALLLWRNYYHGLLMVARKTNGMAMGSMSRVGAIYLFAQFLYFLQILDYQTGTIILLLGFVLEATVVTIFYKRLKIQTA